MKILLVDDDFCNRRLLQKILCPYGDIDHASDGKDALVAIELSLDEKQPYDLVLLDIFMPEVNGLKTLQNIRKYERDSKMSSDQGSKIIMVSTSQESDHMKSAFKNGCESYLIKPITKKRVIEELMKLELIQ